MVKFRPSIAHPIGSCYESSSQSKHITGASLRQEFVLRFLIGSLACVCLLVPASGLTQEAKVKVGLLMINADAGVFLALEKGYFREQGLVVEFNYFASSGGSP